MSFGCIEEAKHAAVTTAYEWQACHYAYANGPWLIIIDH